MSSRGGGDGSRGRGGGRGRGGDAPRGSLGNRGRGSGDSSRGSPQGGYRGDSSRGAPQSGYRGRGGTDFRGGGRGGGFGGRGGSPAIEIAPVNLPPANVDSRLADSDLNQLVKGLSNLKIQGDAGELPIRPGFGTLGRVVKLRANYFPVQKFPSVLYEYDVQMTPKVGPRRLKRRIFELLEETPEFAPFAASSANDGSAKLVSAKQIPMPDSGSFDIALRLYDDDEDGPNDRSKTYGVSISFVAEHETATLKRYLNGEPGLHAYDTAPIIAAFNIVLTKHAINNGGINVGKNRYFFGQMSANQALRLDSTTVAFRGFYLSVRPTFKQLSLNINTATTAFYAPGNLADAIGNFQRETYGGNATSFVKGLRVKTTHLGHKKTVHRVGRNSASRESFAHPQYGKITVEQYFHKQYNITIRQANVPLVDIGTKAKPNWVPPELCEILPNQPFRGKLSANQTRSMIDIACLPPATNQADIYRNGLTNMGISPPSDVVTAFGISLGTEMAVVPARILDAPKVGYLNKTLEVRDSAWNLKDQKFAKASALGDCFALAISERANDFQSGQDPEFVNTVEGFTNMCRTCGLNTTQARWRYDAIRPPNRDRDPDKQQAMQLIESSLKNLPGRPVLVLVVLSSDDKVFYANLKYLLDVKLGVVNVCVIAQKFRKNQPQYFANVALKVNMKLGGVNHTLTGPAVQWLKKKTTMLMGADVTHPSPGSLPGTPSIASVVASVGDSFARYPASLRLQETRKEMITDIGALTIERLKEYAGNNKNQYPDRVIMFRDGVSEGQFLTVLREELPELKDAFRRVKPGYKPTLTIVIAGKRHHTRFFPTDPAGTDERNNSNPKSGMVVDKGVTGVYTFDFFLQSHVGLKGHARPTHYTVVHDENQFTADDLQRLCHDLSHTFARATRGVSLIPPAYYADLACERGRCYIHNLFNDNATTVSSSDPEAQAAVYDRARRLWGDGPHNLIKNKMFYI